VLGSHLLSDAVGDNVHARLAVLLGGIVPQGSLPYVRDFVDRTYQTYAHARLPAQ
jgi:hypothetical protein